ncbi:hypothetical protein SPRG_10065 [Saprolegnia parasitica CBS 223.65]|uniref:Uncharacterized protein n=1 Tax=Saprolegnia parasitica (strain CBS 223.65) TaxID=695850 RepID=A0A067BZF0_SAPPC|nr:hypothetical protein SPRG_10065 [Saprolegnia parasitica CBS 223.65]KDO23919.1 hypothetical protein SPRG_10065 [Saprolegnia parasitica CBS 223.65]|eukprot:XP_012205385.1 hypothetical protein SPRG_10065 [Saprolegnia parasitica CBS 223.65]
MIQAASKPTKTSFDVLGSALATLNVAMTSHFISDHLDIMPSMALAHSLHATLMTVGWEPLARAMTTMLTRWHKYTSDRPLSHSFRLVASLAGVADHPVCPRLDLPFVSELIKLCWPVNSKDLLAPGDVKDTAMTRAGWFTNKLPTILCIEIDTYLLPASTIEQHIDHWMRREPFDVVAPSLVSATKRNPQLRINKNRAAPAGALASISAKNMRNVWGVASALALVAQPWPTTLLQSLWEKMGLALLPAFEVPRYQGRLLAHSYGASSLLRGPVHACSSTRLVLDALGYFRLYDAEKRSAFVDAFLAATASKLEANAVFRNLELQ